MPISTLVRHDPRAQPTTCCDITIRGNTGPALSLRKGRSISACNPVAGVKPGVETLSGLARAFSYAGARAMLVSHWAVDSNSATLLATATFDILKSDPKLGRAVETEADPMLSECRLLALCNVPR